jgi:XTP/dITP diphosphohydrolase
MKILLATWNPDKIRWLSRGFEGLRLPVEAVNPADCAGAEETGDTCRENAAMKALSVGRVEGAIVIAEDSGLFLDGLGGFPGTHTARWAPGCDQDRARLLVEKLRGNPDRRARFISAVCLLFPNGERALCEGTLEGRIASCARGDPETGYAAIFELEGGRTIAEIGETAVAEDDHRQRAMYSARGAIEQWLGKAHEK